MKIVVIYKWARDTAAAAVRDDGSVDWRGAKMSAGEDDHAALDIAKNIAEVATEIAGLCIGDGDASWIVARGVDEAYSVEGAPALNDEAMSAKILASAVKQIGADIVIIGDSRSYPLVASALAGELEMPAILGVVSAEKRGDKIALKRASGANSQEILATAPLLIGVQAIGEEKRPPGMKEMLMARKKSIVKLECGAFDERLEIIKSECPELKSAVLFSGENGAKELIARLKNEGVL